MGKNVIVLPSNFGSATHTSVRLCPLLTSDIKYCLLIRHFKLLCSVGKPPSSEIGTTKNKQEVSLHPAPDL